VLEAVAFGFEIVALRADLSVCCQFIASVLYHLVFSRWWDSPRAG